MSNFLTLDTIYECWRSLFEEILQIAMLITELSYELVYYANSQNEFPIKRSCNELKVGDDKDTSGWEKKYHKIFHIWLS